MSEDAVLEAVRGLVADGEYPSDGPAVWATPADIGRQDGDKPAELAGMVSSQVSQVGQNRAVNATPLRLRKAPERFYPHRLTVARPWH